MRLIMFPRILQQLFRRSERIPRQDGVGKVIMRICISRISVKGLHRAFSYMSYPLSFSSSNFRTVRVLSSVIPGK